LRAVCIDETGRLSNRPGIDRGRNHGHPYPGRSAGAVDQWVGRFEGWREFYGFSAPGTLFYNSTPPADETYIRGSSIVGTAALIGVEFSTPVTFIQFGLEESSVTPAPAI